MFNYRIAFVAVIAATLGGGVVWGRRIAIHPSNGRRVLLTPFGCARATSLIPRELKSASDSESRA